MQQYHALAQNGPLALTTVPKPVPGPNDIVLRTKAVGLNPGDSKIFQKGATVTAWPVVLGHEAAGVVDAVGDAVTAFHVGDEVFAFASSFNYSESCSVQGGAFQEFVLVPQEWVARKPVGLSFEEAAGVPVQWITAAAAIIIGLGIPLPGLGNTPIDPKKAPKSTLVLGGSSGCGAHAVQLLRLALGNEATIVATSSPQHHNHLRALGASSCVSRAEQGSVDVLRKAASTDGIGGFDAVIDCVGAVAENPQILNALKEDGPKLFTDIIRGAEITIPDGVHYESIFCRQIMETDGGLNTFPYIAALFDEGKYSLPVKVEVIGKGYEAIGKGIERLAVGVSGTKLVVSL